MSKIGKKPISIPRGVTVKVSDNAIECKGQSGTVRVPRLPFVAVNIEDETITFKPVNNSLQAKANWGTFRALTQNAITGAARGFQRTLLIEGVGYRATMEGQTLVLYIGYSHPVRFNPPAGVTITVEKNSIRISGAEKETVGKTAAQIRAFKKPEPYKGKGIRYNNEIIRRKAGKKTAGATK